MLLHDIIFYNIVYFRVVFLPRVEELIIAINKLANFLESYRQQ